MSRQYNQMRFRPPPEHKAFLENAAKMGHRSVNQQVVMCIEHFMNSPEGEKIMAAGHVAKQKPAAINAE